MKFKRFFYAIFILTIIFSFVPKFYVNAFIEDDSINDLTITSPVALLMESNTGVVLYNKGGYDKMYPASTTKIMTAILTLENCKLDDIATVSREAIFSVPSDYTNANLQVDEELSIKDLLYAFLIPSANDCGYVLAEHIAGSTEKFADMMNEKAKEIGCQNTHFTNPSGIQDENHYSTAYDLALMGRYAMKNEIFREIVSTSKYTLPTSNKYEAADRIFVNTNFLIRENQPKYYYKYATGIKTGFTDDARDCVVASAKKDGIEYIAVILYAGYTSDWLKEKFVDCVTLFNYAFENYTTKSVQLQGDILKTLKISGATKETKMLNVAVKDDIKAYIKTSQSNENFTPNIYIKEDLKAPISKGEVLGTISYNINDINYSSDLIADTDVEKDKTLSNILKIIVIIIVVLGCMKLISFKAEYERKKHKNYRKKGKPKKRYYI